VLITEMCRTSHVDIDAERGVSEVQSCEQGAWSTRRWEPPCHATDLGNVTAGADGNDLCPSFPYQFYTPI